MSRIWFTSDLHFGHRNIVAYAGRPFISIEEHDAALLAEWREKVALDDEVYFLGDMSLTGNLDLLIDSVLQHLTGQIHVVLGNHDRALRKLRKLKQWADGTNADGPLVEKVRAQVNHIHFLPPHEEYGGARRFRKDGVSCVLSHHPMEDWPGMARHGRGNEAADPFGGRIHLHGHSHGASRRVAGRLDVGWDTARRILSWEDVLEMVPR
jgi:calcineurin-like phosphoesterase family protein